MTLLFTHVAGQSTFVFTFESVVVIIHVSDNPVSFTRLLLSFAPPEPETRFSFKAGKARAHFLPGRYLSTLSRDQPDADCLSDFSLDHPLLTSPLTSFNPFPNVYNIHIHQVPEKRLSLL